MIGFIHYPAWITPQIIPGFPYLRWYGLMYIVAFGITYLLVRVQVKERNLSIVKDDILSLFFWGIIGLLIGARLFAVTIYDSGGYFLRHPLQAVLPIAWIGGKCTFTGYQGMSYHGGLVGAVIAIVIYCRVKHFDLLDWGDMLLAGTPLGYFFGRMGNFINAELYGRVTDLPWGMIFPGAEKIPVKEKWVPEFAARTGIEIDGLEMVNLPRHPSQLYEAFFEGFFLWLVLWFILRKRKPFKGCIIACYIIGYGILRFLIEYTRQPDLGIDFPIKLVNIKNPGYLFLTPWNFTTGQILCFLMILCGTGCLFFFRYLSKKEQRTALKETGHPDLKKLRKKIKST